MQNATAQSPSGNCVDGTTTLNIDISQSLSTTWVTPEQLKPSGQCCGAPDNHRCFELILKLHPEANGVSITFTTPTGSVYYTVNCGPAQGVSSNTLNICFDKGDDQPQYITFCRNGTPSYEFSVSNIVNDDQVTLPEYAPVCINRPGFLLSGGSPMGGMYYINGEINQFFDVAKLKVGDHEITYVYTDPVTKCTNFATTTLSIVPLPEVSVTTQAFCKNDGWVDLSGASPPGGNYTGNYISGNRFNTSAAAAGNSPVTYTYVDENGCSAQATGIITVNPLPDANAGVDQTIAFGSSTSFSAATGGLGAFTYSWTPANMLDNANVQNPATVPLEATMLYNLLVTNTTTGCSATDQVAVVVVGEPIKVLVVPDSICVGSSTSITAIPSGGVSGKFNYHWTSNNPLEPGFPSTQATLTVSPDQLTTYTVTVTDADYSQIKPMAGTATVNVLPLPVVTISMPTSVCASEPNFQLSGGFPAGGIYYLLDASGNVLNLPHIDFSNFLPGNIGAGNYQVMYEYTNLNGCTNTALQPLVIHPMVTLPDYAPVCEGSTAFTLSGGLPAGGTYYVNGIESTSFNVPDLATGDHLITYSVNGCSVTKTIKINARTPITVTPQVACKNEGLIDLTGALPSGGNFSGPFVSSNRFNTTTAGTGPHNITYTYVNGLGCSSQGTTTFTVNPLPIANAGIDQEIIIGDPPTSLLAENGGPGTYSYSWTPANRLDNANVQNPNTVLLPETTVFNLLVTNTTTGCSASDQVTIVVTGGTLSLYIASGTNPICIGGSTTLSVVPSGGVMPFTYIWTSDNLAEPALPATQTINVSPIIDTRYTVEVRDVNYPTTDPVTETIIVTVHSLPIPIITMDASVCVNASSFSLSTNLPGGDFYLLDVNGNAVELTHNGTLGFLPNNIEAGNYQVMYVYTDPNGCTNTAFQDFVINPLVTLPDYSPVCQGSPDFTLGGGYPAGGTYYVNGIESTSFNVSGLATGIHQITYLLNGCSVTKSIEIIALPAITLTPLAACKNSGLINLTGATPSGGIFSGDFISNNRFNTSAAAVGSYTITYTYGNQYGCTSHKETTFTVNPLPVANAGADTLIEIGKHASFEATVEGPGDFSYNWTPSNRLVPGDALVLKPNTVALSESTIFQLQVTNTETGCRTSDHVAVNVTNALIKVAYALSDPSTICFGGGTTITIIPSGGISGEFTYSWTSDNPNETGLTPTAIQPVSPLVTTTYTVVVSDARYPQLTPAVEVITITVLDLPDVTIDMTAEVCANTPNFKLSGGKPEGGVYSILDMNGDELSFPYVNFNNFLPQDIGVGNFQVKYEYIDPISKCSAFAIQPLTILPYVKAQFYASKQDLCISDEVFIANHSEGATQYLWDFGDGNTSGEIAPTFTYKYNEVSEITGYDIKLIAENDEGCTSTIKRNVKIYPATVSEFTTTPAIGCAPLDVQLTSQATGSIKYLFWEFGDGAYSMMENPVHTFVNNTDADIIYDVTLYVQSNNPFCNETSTHQVVVHPAIKAGFTLTPVTGCQPLEVEFGNLATGATEYFWDFGNGNTYTQANPPAQEFVNNTDSIIQFTIRQVVRNAHCADSLFRTIDVYPAIHAVMQPSVTEGCSPLAVDFSNLSSNTATWFEWSFGDGASSPLREVSHVFENNTDATQIFTVWLKVRSNDYCLDSVSVDIIVHPFLKADFDFTPAQACNPHEVTIFNRTYGAVQYEWSIDGVPTYAYGADSLQFSHEFDHNDPVSRTYELKLLVTNAQGCTDSLTRSITIFPKIQSVFTTSLTEGCSPLEVSFTNSSTGAARHRWEFGDGGSSILEEPVHIFENTSFTQVALFNVWLYSESDELCRDSISTTITVYPKVSADFTVLDNRGCSPLPLEIFNHSQGFASLAWNFGDGESSTDSHALLTHVFENKNSEVETYTIELIATNQQLCVDSLKRTITVYPEVNIDFAHTIEGCHPLQVSFDNNTTNAQYFDWDFSGGITSGVENPEHVFHNFSHENNTDYNINLFASSVYGCFSSGTSSIRVYPKPLSQFNVLNSPGCSPHEIAIEHASQGATGYLWDFGDGSGCSDCSSSTLTHLYNRAPGSGPGYYNVSLITSKQLISTLSANTFTCRDTLEQSVVIYPDIQASFIANVVEGCHPLEVTFTNLSLGAATQGTNPTPGAYTWDYGNGNKSNNLLAQHSHTFFNHSHTRDTIYQVVLQAYNNNLCTDTDTLYIRVKPRPRAMFTVPNNPGCASHDLIINNTSIGAFTYRWDMGDGTAPMTHPDAQFTHPYHQPHDLGPGQYTIQLRVESDYGCSDTHTQQVIVYPEVIASFTMPEAGCHPHTANFTNTSGGGNLYRWDFGNGVTSREANPTQVFVNYSHTQSEIYTVSLHVESTYGCQAQLTREVTVHPVPKPLFAVEPFTGCAPFTPQLSDLSTGATQYYWNLGNATMHDPDSTFVHTWYNTTNEPLQYPLSLTAMNEHQCMASTAQVITVFPQVMAEFATEDNRMAGCSPLTLRFVNNSHLANLYQWDFAGEKTSSSAQPLYIFQNDEVYEKNFPVELVVSSIYGCKDSIMKEVTVFPAPEAFFSVDPKKQPYPLSLITATNLTNPGMWDFQWEFGDGNFIHTTSFDPVQHAYLWDSHDMSTKEYVVALLVNNEHCSDMHTETVTITSPVPKADVNSVTTGCAPFEVQFSNHSSFAHSYRWDFGDGSYSDEPAPKHTFLDAGHYTISMVAHGDGGRDTVSHQVEVIENPTALFSLVTPHVNIPEEPLRLVNNSLLGDMYFWDFGDGNTSYEFEPVYYYTTPGIYDIQLVVTRTTQPLCYDTLRLKNALRVDETCKIVFPDAFMPSLDGPNDGAYDLQQPSTQVFHPVYEGIEDYVLEIYNRWGELIFRSTDIRKGWDGYFKGRLSSMDVYVWTVRGQCTNGSSIHMQGNVTLYR